MTENYWMSDIIILSPTKCLSTLAKKSLSLDKLISVINTINKLNADGLSQFYKFCPKWDNLQRRHRQKLSWLKTGQKQQNK